MSGAGHVASIPAGRRTVTELIRRGLDNAVANWPLLLIRVAEAVVLGILVLVSVIGTIVPPLISIGLSRAMMRDPEQAAEVLRAAFIDHWLILVYIAGAISVALLVMVAVHSFVIAGTARVLVDAERRAGAAAAGRQFFAAFSVEAWGRGGREVWWRVFWIYNIAYGVAGIVVMLPLAPLALAIIVFQAAPAAIALSCLGLIVAVFFALIVLVVTSIVCQKAIVLAAGSSVDAAAALAVAWRTMRDDFNRHFGVAFIMIVLTIGGSGVLGAFSVGFSLPGMSSPFGWAILLPVRMAGSLISSIWSAAVSNWFLASFAALSGEKRLLITDH